MFVKLTENGCLQLFNNKDDKDPFQELPLQACYSVSDIGKRLRPNARSFNSFKKGDLFLRIFQLEGKNSNIRKSVIEKSNY